MNGTLKRKTVREVHSDKVIRLRIDIPFDEVSSEGGEGQDVHEWLDHKVGDEIRFDVLPFVDEDQTEIEDVLTSDSAVETGITSELDDHNL